MSPRKTPLYSRLLRLRHLDPRGWQRAVLADGSVAVAVVLVLADVATAWTIVVLPLAVAAVVKAHDVVAGWLGAPLVAARQGGDGSDPEPDAAADLAADPAAERVADDAAAAPATGGHVAVRPRPRKGGSAAT